MNLIKEESMWYIGNDESPSLSHHGILGMKWGIRRYQNSDGTYTSAGKSRYGIGDGKSYNGVKKKDAFSAKAAGHKALAKVYEMNEKVYKNSNKALSSMNKAAKNDQLKAAKKSQESANKKRDEKQEASNKKKQEKIEKYRDKMSEKALKNADRASETAKQKKYEMEDLKKHGVKSSTYKAWEANDKLKDVAKGVSPSAGDFARAISVNMTLNELITTRQKEYKSYTKSAESWMKTHEEIMSKDISSIPSKKDVWKTYIQPYLE